MGYRPLVNTAMLHQHLLDGTRRFGGWTTKGRLPGGMSGDTTLALGYVLGLLNKVNVMVGKDVARNNMDQEY